MCTRFLEHDFDLSGIGYRLCEKPGQTYIYEADEQLNGMILSLLPGAVTGTAVTGDCFVNDGELREKLKTELMPSAVIWKQPPLHMSAHSREFRSPLSAEYRTTRGRTHLQATAR